MKDFKEKYGLEIGEKILSCFNSVYIVDFKHKTTHDYYYGNTIAKTMSDDIAEKNDYPTIMKRFADRFVVKEERERFLIDSDIDHVWEELAEHGEYSHRFLRYDLKGDIEYIEAAFQLVSKRDKVGILVYRNVDIHKSDSMSGDYDALLKSSDKRNEKKTVLIIDDDPTSRMILSEILSSDFEIVEAENGKEGLDILSSNSQKISLVFLDLVMPVFDGISFLHEFNRTALISKIPVIVATAYSGTKEENEVLQLGAIDFVSKPYIKDIVVSRAKNAIKLAEASQILSAIEFDTLTGVYTKDAFIHHATAWVNQNPTKKFDIVTVDIIDFREFQDKYGEVKTNGVLLSIANRLKEINKTHIVGRVSTDQFAIMAINEEEEEIPGINDLHNNVFKDTNVSSSNIKCGVYRNIDHSTPIVTCVNRTLIAIKSIAKEYDKYTAYYDDELNKHNMYLNDLENLMEEALQKEEFVVYYQPKSDAATGKIIGAEALVRWISPKYGFISPGDFISLFENNGFITKLDKYVLEKVCKDIVDWNKRGIKVFPISFNTSRRDFYDSTHLKDCFSLIRRYKVPTDKLHMEITESHYATNADTIIHGANEVRKTGIKIEMDDFGSGYSSLGMITKISLDVIKLDMSFVRNIDTEKPIIESVIYMAHKIGCKVVAEGVETEEELNTLRAMGCDFIQGYYFSKPLAKADFEKYAMENQ